MKAKKQKLVEIEGRKYFIIKCKNGEMTTRAGFYEGHYLIKNGLAYAGGNVYPIKEIKYKKSDLIELTYDDLRRELVGCS